MKLEFLPEAAAEFYDSVITAVAHASRYPDYWKTRLK